MIHVRTIDVDDWPLWRELRLEALREAPYAFGTTLAEWQGEGDTELRWRARLSSVPVNMVAYLNGKVAGIVSGIPPDEDGTTELISMWAAPFARGKGVGDALVTSVIEWARGQHAAKIALDVVETNERAISLYRRHGFVDAAPVACADPCVASERQMVLALQS